jgi:hypothetical protein
MGSYRVDAVRGSCRPRLLPPRRPVHDVELVHGDRGPDAGVKIRQDPEDLIRWDDEA